MAEETTCRLEVWLWRARFCKSRALAARLVGSGRVRLTRMGRESRLDKPAYPVRPGDDLVFAMGGRLTAVRILDLGARRGPPAEARALYSVLEGDAERVVDALGEGDRDARH